MEPLDWEDLLSRIKDKQCTPIIGPGINTNILKDRSQLAQEWASRGNYPFLDKSNLSRVAQFMSVERYPAFPYAQMQKMIKDASERLTSPPTIFTQLAELHLPVYVTTNFDNLLKVALENQDKDVESHIYPWNAKLKKEETENERSPFPSTLDPDPLSPLVYHLHGRYDELNSMVIKEEDYLSFVGNVAFGNEYELPHQILNAFTTKSLILLGFDPNDWEFRSLVYGLLNRIDTNERQISVTAQFPLLDEDDEMTEKRAKEYLEKSFGNIDSGLRVFWGSTEQFIQTLSEKWKGSGGHILKIGGDSHTVEVGNDDDGGQTERASQAKLLHVLKTYFSHPDLQELVFLMIPNSDHPSPELNLKTYARQIITYLHRHDRLPELEQHIRDDPNRKNIEWDS